MTQASPNIELSIASKKTGSTLTITQIPAEYSVTIQPQEPFAEITVCNLYKQILNAVSDAARPDLINRMQVDGNTLILSGTSIEEGLRLLEQSHYLDDAGRAQCDEVFDSAEPKIARGFAPASPPQKRDRLTPDGTGFAKVPTD